MLIEGLLQVQPARWTLDVVGDMSANDAYAATVRHSLRKIEDPVRVTLHGQLPDGDLKRLLDASHVLAVPSTQIGRAHV